jgi:presqualene diphosphate synthase
VGGVTALDAAPSDLAEVERVVKRAGTSFYRGMKVLPRDRRAAMYAIYAFCRIVDDVADEPAPMQQKLAGLADWRARIAALYAGRADDAVTRVLASAIHRYELRQADFVAVIDGMAMDTEQPIVAPDLATLDLYCDRVAAAVGRLSVRAFGDSSPAADEVAWHLGRALQLTNILRDVAEDAGRGRLYFPREWLDDAAMPHDPHELLGHPALPALCARMAAQAHVHFDAAHAAMDRCDRAAMKPARLMGATYAALLEALQRRGWAHPDVPVRLTRWQKLWIALRHL